MSTTGVERRYASNSGHWPKSVCISSTLCVPGVAARQYRMAWKGKPHAVCAVSACQPGGRQVLCRVCQPFRPHLWGMRDAEPLRCSLLRSLCNPPDRRGDSHASPPATATRGSGGGAFPRGAPSGARLAAAGGAGHVSHPHLSLWPRRGVARRRSGKNSPCDDWPSRNRGRSWSGPVRSSPRRPQQWPCHASQRAPTPRQSGRPLSPPCRRRTVQQ